MPAAETAVSAFRITTNFTEGKTILVVILLTIFAHIALATLLAGAQDTTQEKEKASGAARWSGAIQRIDKDNLTLTVRKPDGRTKTISCTTTTKWSNKAGATVDSTTLKQDDRVVCLGKYEGSKFVAADIILQQ
jgi:hypothetical protein